jgi:fatty-acid desaturase
MNCELFQRQEAAMTLSDFKKPALIALVVCVILSLINQPESIFKLNFTPGVIVKIILNFIVPFCVASVSRFITKKEFDKKEAVK